MRTIAIILAGGIGTRVGANIPKQFLLLNDKPIILYTLECFEKNANIDGIVVVCVKEWIPYLNNILSQNPFTKPVDVIEGGATGHDSTRNGLFFLKDKLNEDDFVVIHDSVRPILPQKALNDLLSVAHEKGNASLAIPCYETVIYTDDGLKGSSQLDRNSFLRIQTPQAYRYSLLLSIYEKAEMDDIHDFVYADIALIHYGEVVYFSKGFINNIKITRKEDLPLCNALMSFSEDELYTC